MKTNLTYQNRGMYDRWKAMVRRCHNPNSHDYERYGARGVEVCDRWRFFGNFLEDMGNPPFEGAQIDRIDNESGYSRANCRWVSVAEQQKNKRPPRIWNDSNLRKFPKRMLSFRGKTQSVFDWSKETGISYAKLRQRLWLGWSVERALTTLAFALIFLPSVVLAEEIVLPPSKEEIDAFNACLRGKANIECVLPTRTTVLVGDVGDDTLEDEPFLRWACWPALQCSEYVRAGNFDRNRSDRGDGGASSTDNGNDNGSVDNGSAPSSPADPPSNDRPSDRSDRDNPCRGDR